MGFGVSCKVQINNVDGGYVDYVLDLNLGLVFLWYMDFNGFNLFYMGMGVLFDLCWYELVEFKSNFNYLDNDMLFGVGVLFYGILGYEFLWIS